MLLVPFILLNVLIYAQAREAPNKALMQCFRYKYNYWLLGFAFHTMTVAYKDDCLRYCLTASLRGDVECKSVMHIPEDGECVLTDQSRHTQPELFIENDREEIFTVNYYENICSITPVEGGRATASLSSYSGSVGQLNMVQAVNSQNAYISTIVYNLSPGQHYEMHLSDSLHQTPDKSCTEAFVTSLLPAKTASVAKQRILSVEADHTGMAVVAWQQVPVSIYGQKSAINKLVMVSHAKSNKLETCGMVYGIGNYSDYEKVFSAKAGNSNLSFFVVILVSAVVCFVFA